MSFEKSYFDLLRNLNRANYYDCKVMFRSSPELRSTDYIGHFHKRLGDGFSLSKCDSDYSFGLSLEIDSTLEEGKEYHCQLVCLYTDSAGNDRLRVFNYSFKAVDDMTDYFNSTDVDCCLKIVLMKEINNCFLVKNFVSSHESLFEKVVNTMYAYRDNCCFDSDLNQLVLPVNLRFFILFINSFLKKPAMLKEKKSVQVNEVVSFVEKVMRMTVYSLVKLVYPRVYRVDSICADKDCNKAELAMNRVGTYNEQLKAFNKPDLVIPMMDMVKFEGLLLISCLFGG